MAHDRSRRGVLALLGTAGVGTLAGCSAFEDHPELLVFNRRSGSVSASISLLRIRDDTEVFSETFRLAAGEDVRRQVDLSPDPHRIATDVEDGPERSTVWEPGGEGCCIEVRVRGDSIEYSVRAY